MNVFAVVQWLTLVSQCALVGGLVFAIAAMPGHKTQVLRELSAPARRQWLQACWLLCVLVTLLAFLIGPARVEILAVRGLALAVIARLVAIRHAESWLGATSGALLLLTQSLTSRSAQQTNWVAPLLADWFHLVLAALWLGGVGLLLSVAFVAARNHPQDMQPSIVGGLSATLDRFSALALFCVLGVALSGIAQAGLFLQSFEALWMTPYGRTLTMKLGLFALLIGLGALHRQVFASALRRALLSKRAHAGFGYVTRLRWSLLLEVFVGVGLLGAVGWLIAQPR
jgi:putative copper export protein